jgi:hypothetical protein
LVSLTKNYFINCKSNLGGVRKLYLFPFVKYSRSLISVVGNVLVSYPTTVIYEFDFVGTPNVDISQDENDGGKFYNNNITFDLLGLKDAVEIQKLAKKDYIIIFEDENGNNRILGLKNGLALDSLTSNTGGAKSDLSGFNLSFKGQEEEEPYFINNLSNAGFVLEDEPILDPDALLYLTNSGIVDPQIIDSVNVLFIELKNSSLYDKIKAGWLHAGDTYDKQKLNIKNPIDSDAAFRLTNLNVGGISRFTDVNGTTEVQDTHFNMSNELDVSSCGATITSGGQFFSSEGNRVAFGAVQPSKRFSIVITNGSIGVFRISSQIVPTQPNGSGIFTAQSSNSLGTYFRDGVKLTSGTVTGSLPTFSCYLNGMNNQGAASNVDARRLQTCLIHEALNDLESVSLHNIIDTFENSLNRKTW